jgi:ectoine hydroxylase-related dioxygenase (phytanoyl-CoA dioxygenase family)
MHVDDAALRSLEADGFAIVRQAANAAEVTQLAAALADASEADRSTNRDGAAFAARNVLAILEVANFIQSPSARRLVEPVLGRDARAVQGLLFDKVASANWRVGWHQDLVVPVRERVDSPGYTAWSVKRGVPHVKPPAGALERMLIVRWRLDDCGPDNGPLQVIPGSHQNGELGSDDVKKRIRHATPTLCTGRKGDALLMRPLLLHASSKATAPKHRRVLHVLFASAPLPHGLDWPALLPTAHP